MLKKQFFVLTVAILALSMILAACGTPTTAAPAVQPTAPAAPAAATAAPATGDVVTITMWHGFNAHEVDFLKGIIDKYWTPTHPNIKVITEGNKSNQDILTAMSGGDSPDLVMSGSSEAITLWASQGAIMDLTPAIEPVKAQLESEMVPAGLQWVQLNGKYYGLPFVNYNEGLFYNKDLFTAAGLDPNKPPETLDQLKEYAQKLTKVDANGNITQLGWLPINSTDRAINFILNSGGKFYDPATLAPTFNDPANVAAFQWDLDFQKIYGLDKVTAFTTGFNSGDNPFQLGKVAMYIDGCWNPEFFKLNAPNLHYGVAAIPYSDAKFAKAGSLGTNPLAVPVASKHQKEAIEFAIWLAMSKDVAREFSAEISNIPQIKSELTTFTTDPDTKFFADMSSSANTVAWAPVPYSQEYLNDMTSAIGDMYNKGVAPKDALDAAQKIIETAAASYIKK
jgi:multiple sugar transport system substrate-binding protein